MKPPLVLLFTLVLALAGFLAGRGFSGSLQSRETPVSASSFWHGASESPKSEGRPLRDPRSGLDFGQALEAARQPEAFVDRKVSVRGYFETDRRGRRLLELERAFALATEEEMIAFFDREDIAELEPELLSLAYARLARLSPETAAAIWSDEFRRGGNGAGIDGLVRAWAERDALAAERWVDGLPEGPIRAEALAALLLGALDTSLELVARRLLEVDAGNPASQLAAELGRRLDLSRLPGLADRLLATRRGEWSSQGPLSYFLVEWGGRDAAGMLSWLAGQPKGEVSERVFSRVVGSRVAADPAAFAREIGPSLASDPALGEMAGIAVLAWLDLGGDDEAALAWLAEHGANLDFSGALRDLSGLRRRWSEDDAARVLGGLSAVPESRGRHRLAMELLDRLAVAAPDSALSLSLEYLPANERAEWYLSRVQRTGVHRDDAEAGLEWVLRHLEDGGEKSAAVGNFLAGIARTDPLAAMERAAALPESMRRNAMDRLARDWAQRAPQGFVESLKAASDPASQAALARAGFRELGSRGGGDEYLAQALALPEGRAKEEAVTALFSGWSRANLESSSHALDGMARGPLRDAAIAAFVSNAADIDRAAALAWSLDIGDPQRRRATTRRQAQSWLRSDPAAATRWIEASEAMPEEWKAELLEGGR